MTTSAFSNLHVDLVGVTDAQWRNMIIRSLDGPEVGGYTLPAFPTANVQSRTTRVADQGMLREAFKLYSIIKAECERLNRPIGPQSRILDFGCGWGRIARFFLKEVPAEQLFGVDVVDILVKACQDTIASSQFQVIEQRGNLPFNDGSFDVVFANSVFSHLDEDLHLRWIAEIERVLAPGGVAAITVIAAEAFNRWLAAGNEQTKRFLDKIGDEASVRRRVEANEFVWCDTSRVGVLEGYGITVTPIPWLREHWPAGLTVHNVRHDYGQDVVIATRQ